MSASPQQEDPADRYDEDIEENDQPNAEEPEAATAPKDAQPHAKRGRGRPKGSKNKKPGAASATGPSEGTPVKKKRGRPPKEKKQDDSGAEEPPAKRRRGRPRKEQKPQEAATAATSAAADGPGESSVKKKRGRPPKKT